MAFELFSKSKDGCLDFCNYSNFAEAERRSLSTGKFVFCERINGIVKIKKRCADYMFSQAILDFVAAGDDMKGKR